MNTKRPGGLGRNLSALLGQQPNDHSQTSRSKDNLFCAVDHLQPGKYQPRGDFDEASLAELADSIRKQGLLQPLVVRPLDQGRYEIIAGERRWRACQQAGLRDVPIVVRDVDDETAMAMALVENLQREELNAMDQARAMQRLVEEFQLTHQQIAQLLSKSRTAVSNSLRLFHLAPDVQRMLEHGDLDMGHARALLMLEQDQQVEMAKLVVARGLSVRETEAWVKRIKAGPRKAPQKADLPVSHLLTEQIDALSAQLKTRVNLKHGTTGKGVLMIHYNDLISLESMLTSIRALS